MRYRVLIFACCLTSAVSGCAVRGLHKDQDRLRTALVDLSTNQVMDNLVRASNGLPIIHLDYTNANMQLTVDVSGSVGDTASNMHSTTLAALSLSSTLITRTIANTVAGTLGLSRTNQVAVTATPVTTTNQVYDAYLSFLTIPGSLQVTCSPPPPGAAHVWRCFQGQYYWVPVEFRDRYFELATITTAQRTKSLLPPNDYYSVNLIKFPAVDKTNQQPNAQGTTLVLVQIDQSVPIRTNGRVTFENGRTLLVSRYDGEGNDRIDFVSDKFYLAFNANDNPAALKFPIPVRLYLDQPPPPPTTKDLLGKIPFQKPQVSIGAGTTPAAQQSSSMPLLPTPPGHGVEVIEPPTVQ